jgi:hypothetical protein
MDFDLSSAKALCEAGGKTYDEQAVRLCVAMQPLLARLPREQQPGQLLSILNAIESQVEERGEAYPPVVRILGDALLALAAARRLKPRALKKLTQLLGQLHSLVVERAAPPR